MDQQTKTRIEEITNELTGIEAKIMITDDIYHIDIAVRNLNQMLKALNRSE